MNRYLHATLIVCLILPAAAHVEAQVSSETAAKIDTLAEKALAETATPSASMICPGICHRSRSGPSSRPRSRFTFAAARLMAAIDQMKAG